jgi:hypothetical protein
LSLPKPPRASPSAAETTKVVEPAETTRSFVDAAETTKVVEPAETTTTFAERRRNHEGG